MVRLRLLEGRAEGLHVLTIGEQAREAPSFGAIYDGRALALALGGRIGLLLLSTAIDHLS